MQPTNDNLAKTPASPLFFRSFDAFYRNLPHLLGKYYGKWVAYHGDEFVGTGRSATDLRKKCLRRGFKEDKFAVLFVTSQALYDQEEIPLLPNW